MGLSDIGGVVVVNGGLPPCGSVLTHAADTRTPSQGVPGLMPYFLRSLLKGAGGGN